jgi:outer membrane cobalamin receptor
MYQLSPTTCILKYPATNVTNKIILMPSINFNSRFRWLFLLLILLTSFFSFSQDLNKKITITCKNKPLIDVIKEISEKGNIYFSYNPQIIPPDKKISFKALNQTIYEILNEVLIQNGLEYSVIENQVVLKKQATDLSQQKISSHARPEKLTVSGFIKEKSTGEVLIGANVYAKGTNLGTTSNGYGFYSLTLPTGKYQLVYSFIGYFQKEEETILDQNIIKSVELEEMKTDIKEVEILATGLTSATKNNQLSELSFSHKTLAQLPGFAGDIDIIRALQVIPGIQSFGDGSSLYYVRGGNSDQNLLMIDDVPVYNPSHLFGFFSAFSPDAINDVHIYKGDFPAKYGGRLSSVIDIKVKDGNMKKLGFSGNLGPYASSLTFEGPIVKDKVSFLLSGRISTLSWLTGLTKETQHLDFLFYDFNGKLNYRINDRNRIFLTFYTGKDDFSQITNSSYLTYGISWNNLAGTLRWNHVFSNRLFSNTTVNFSRYNYYLYISENRDDYWNSSISNLTAKSDFTWYLNPWNTLKAGLEVSSHQSNPGNVTLVNGSVQQEAPGVSKYHSMEYDFYISNEQSIWKKVLVCYGIRLPVWQDFGPTNVYYFNVSRQVSDTVNVGLNKSYSTFFRPEPRISIQYSFNDGSFLKTSYCRTSQFMQVLSNSTSPFTTLAVWVPAGPNIPPQTADQFAVGYFRKFFRSRLNFSAELYYKYYNNNIDYKDHANLLYNPLIEGELRFGKAWSYGIELMLRKTVGNFTGWIGYTFSRAFIKTIGVNGDKTYPAAYDRPNDVCINFSYTDTKHWTLTANWIYLTGGAITTPTGFYYNNGYSVPIYGNKNNDRLPDYHRLDISASYTFSKPKNRYQHSLTITMYNAYGRFNPFSVNFNKMISAIGDYIVPSNITGSYQLIPTTISAAGMIPSINYQFRF